MLRFMATGATALALLSVPATAQEAGTTQAAGAGEQAAGGGQDASAMAMQQAEGAGMQDVQPMEGAFALQGTAPSGMPVIMVVGPAGELIALATPIGSPSTGGQAGQAEGTAGTGAEAAAGGEAGGEPEAGEPAQSGFMATQTDPATPGMWDPAQVESAMQSLELGQRGAAGQVAEPEVNQ